MKAADAFLILLITLPDRFSDGGGERAPSMLGGFRRGVGRSVPPRRFIVRDDVLAAVTAVAVDREGRRPTVLVRLCSARAKSSACSAYSSMNTRGNIRITLVPIPPSANTKYIDRA